MQTKTQRTQRMTAGLGILALVLVGAVALTTALPATAVAKDKKDQSRQQMTDAKVTDAVSDALFLKHGVPGYVINVRTNDGIVKLTGTVNNIMAKERAVRVAQTVKGVRGVVNRLEVADLGRSDEAVRGDVHDALLVDPATDSWEIEAKVSDGTVKLTGTVESWQEKQLAGKVAKSVRGVRALNNKIDIDYRMERGDAELRAEIVQGLRWHALVDDALIDVRVNDGEVTLTGTVGSAAERRRARVVAWVTGVESVDTTDLDVESWARDERFRREKYVYKSDEKIKEAVADALAYDARVNPDSLNITVDRGVVRLNGKVDNLKSKRSAARTARHVVGVWRVKNRIDVRPSTPSDATIADNIRAGLRRDPYVERFEVSVWVNNGEANLSGTVDTYYEKFQAGDVAAGTYGVVEVDNNIIVEDEYDVLTYDPYVDEDWYMYDEDWYVYPEGYTTTQTDWEIREDIRDELWWSPFVDSDEVTVTVDDGVATLTGVVDTWNERQAATENAYEGGAVSVDNDLSVHYGPDYYEP